MNFGRIRAAGVVSGLSKFRIEWWDDVVAEARRVDASSVVVRVDQIQWLLARVDRSDDTPAERPAGSVTARSPRSSQRRNTEPLRPLLRTAIMCSRATLSSVVRKLA